MVAIGFDRYNVIVKGFAGTKITAAKAAAIITAIWIYGILGCCPPFWGWGGYKLGNLNYTKYNKPVPIKKGASLPYKRVFYHRMIWSLFSNHCSCCNTASWKNTLI